MDTPMLTGANIEDLLLASSMHTNDYAIMHRSACLQVRSRYNM